MRDLRHLTTDRLTLDEITAADGADLRPLVDDPRVARTLTATGEPPAYGAEPEHVEKNDAHWQRHGFGLWILRDRLDPAHPLIGRGGLQHTAVEGIDEVEVAWAIVSERWREGLATELALTSVEVAFTDLMLDSIVAFTRPDNLASRRVMEKANFTYERDFVHSGLPHVLYLRTRC